MTTVQLTAEVQKQEDVQCLERFQPVKREDQAHDYECGSVEEGWHTEVVVSQIEIKTLTNTLACSPILSYV